MAHEPHQTVCASCGKSHGDCPECGAGRCRECGAAIPPRALKCAECGAYQDARRHIFASSSVLAAVLALLPLWSGAYSAYSIANPATAEVRLELAECRRNSVQLYISNTGGTRAVLQRPILQKRVAGSRWRFQEIPTASGDPVEEDDLSIDPGEVDMIRIRKRGSGFFSPAEFETGTCHLGVAIPWVGQEEDVLKRTCKCQAS